MRFLRTLCLSAAPLAIVKTSETKLNLTGPTRFESTSFSAIIPKGWSARLIGPDKRFPENLLMTPGPDMENSAKYIGLHLMAQAPSMTLEKKQAYFSTQPGITTRFVTVESAVDFVRIVEGIASTIHLH